MKYLLNIVVILITLSSSLLSAKPFAINNPDIFDARDLKLWNEKYKNIKSYDELDDLLKSISNKYQLKYVEAINAKNIIRINVEKAILIEKFDIKMTISEYISEVQSLLNFLILKVDSKNTDMIIEKRIKNFLVKKGYHKGEISIKKDYVQQRVRIQIIVDEKKPCLIREIKYKLDLPEGFSSNLEVGDICDIDLINQSAENLQEQLKDADYINSQIKSPKVDYDGTTNSSIITYDGAVGKIITYEVKNLANESFLNRIFINDSLNKVDENLTDPDTIRNELIKNYQNEGYNDVVVTLSHSENKSKNLMHYTFTVDSGIQYLISNIQVEGLSYISRKKALEIMGFESLGTVNYLNIDSLNKAMDNLSAYFISEGFWDFKIEPPRIMKNATLGEARVIYLVTEGKRRILDSIVIEGNESLSNDEIRRLITVKKGTPIEWQKIIDFEKSLLKRYRNFGYLYVNTDIKLVQSHNYRDIQTKIIVSIKEGIRVKFGRITINGNIKTKTRIIAEKILFAEGEYYSLQNINKTKEALAALGLFSSINISPTRSYDIIEKQPILPYSVIVSESRPGTITFGPGWTLFDGFRFSFNISYNNLFGTARKIFLKTQYSEETQQKPIDGSSLLGYQFAIGYIEPTVFKTPANLTLALSLNSQATIQSWQFIKSQTISLDHLSLYSMVRYKTSLYFQGQDTSEIGASEVEDIGLISSNDTHTRKIGLNISLDYRDDIIWPTSGGIVKLMGATALDILKADITYHYAGAAVYQNFAFFKDLVLTGKLEWIEFINTNRTDADLNIPPESDRLFSGGATTNRGFKEGILGPIISYGSSNGSQKYYTGGTRKQSYSIELKYRVVGNFSVSTFFDTSNVALSNSEQSEMDAILSRQRSSTNNMSSLADNAPYTLGSIFKDPKVLLDNNYSSYGLSLNILTPLGSMNASYGWPLAPCLNRQKNCEYPRAGKNYSSISGGVFHVNIGATF